MRKGGGKMSRLTAYLLALLLGALPFSAPGVFRGPAENGPALRALLVACDHFVSQPDTAPAAEHNVAILR